MKTHITTSDGTQLAATITGPAAVDADATIVFVHGLCTTGASWARTAARLRRTNPHLRIVTYDLRGHGHSAADPATCTLDTLGHDLDTVISTTAPCGPLLIAGHSMGGMLTLSHLRLYPTTAHRLSGVALLSTATGGLAHHGLTRLLPFASAAPVIASTAPALLERGWDLLRRAATPLAGPAGSAATRPAAGILASYLASLRHFDETTTLECLRNLPALVMCGDRDHITPVDHARRIADHLPASRLTIIAGAGHQLPLTSHAAISDAINDLADAALGRRHLAAA